MLRKELLSSWCFIRLRSTPMPILLLLIGKHRVRNVLVFEKLNAKVFKRFLRSLTIVISDYPVALVILEEEPDYRRVIDFVQV